MKESWQVGNFLTLELKDFCRTSKVNELAIKNEELRNENNYLQEKLTSLGLRLEDLKNQKADAGKKLIEKKKEKKKKPKAKKKEIPKPQDKPVNKDLIKARAEVKRLVGENRVLSRTKTKMEDELEKVKDKLESEKEKTIWLNQENLKLKDSNKDREEERAKVQEAKGKTANDVNRLERELKMANFAKEQEVQKMEKIRKNLDLQLKNHFYGFPPEEAEKKELTQEEQIDKLLKKIETVRKKFEQNLEDKYEAERTAKTAELLKIKAEKLKIASDREIEKMRGLVSDMESFKEKAMAYDELKKETDDLREIKNQFDIFKREAENFMKVQVEKDKQENELKALRLKYEKVRLKLSNADETIREKNFELGEFNLVKAGIEAKCEAKVQQFKEVADRSEKKSEKLYDEMGKLATEKIYLEVLQANNNQKNDDLMEIIKDLQKEKRMLAAEAEQQKKQLFENERVKMERDRLLIEVEALRKELSQVKESNNTKERQLNQLFEKYGDFGGMKDQIKKLEEKLKERDGQIMDMVFEINTRAREIDLEKKEIESLSEELRETRKKLRNAEKMIAEKKESEVGVGVVVDEDTLEELDKLKGENKRLDLENRNKELEIKNLEDTLKEMKEGKEDLVTMKEYLLLESEKEQCNADTQRHRERVQAVLKEKKMVEEIMEENDVKVRQLYVDISEVREELNKQLIQNKELNKGIRHGLKRQQEMGLEIEELRDIINYKDEMIKVEKKNIERMQYVLDESKKDLKDTTERARRAEERLPELEDLLVEMENEKIDMEENQIFVINNFLERIQSKDLEIERKLDTLGYKDQVIKRLTDEKNRLNDKVKMMDKLIREFPEERLAAPNQSTLRLSKNASRIGGKSRIKSKIGRQGSESESKMGFISGGAILEDIDMVAREKEMNRKLKEQVKLLNDRVMELESSLEGGTKMLTENASKLQQEMKKLDIERQRLLVVEKEKVLQDELVIKMNETMKKFATEKLAAEIMLKKSQEQYQKNIEEVNKEVEELNAQLEAILKSNKEMIGDRDKTVENLILKLRNKEREREELQEDNERLERELSKAANERDYLLKEEKDLLKKIKKQKKHIEKQEEYIQEILEETDMRGASIKTLDKRVEGLELEIKSLEEKAVKLKEKHKDVVDTKEVEIKRIGDELKNNQKERDEIQKKVDEFMDENGRLNQKIDDLNKENKLLEKDLDEYHGKTDDYVDFLEKKKQLLEDKLASKMADLDECRVQLETKATGDAKELRKKNTELENKLNRTDLIIDKMWGKVKGLKEENDDLRETMRKINADPTLGAKEIMKMNDKFNEIKIKMVNFKKKEEEARAKLKREKDEAVQKMYKLTDVCEDLKKEKSQLFYKLSLTEIKIFSLVSRIAQKEK